jgi:glycosyltransferase involved in cell wall biosynthesis
MIYKCLYDYRWSGRHGIGRFAEELSRRLSPVKILANGKPVSPIDSIKLFFTLIFNRKFWFFSPGYNGPLFSFVPYVITLHDLNHIDRFENSSLLKKIYYKIILKRICWRASAVITVSDYSKGRIIKWLGCSEDKIFNVGNGVSCHFSQHGEGPDFNFKYILCVSNRKGHKNEKGALHGFLNSNLPNDIKLVFTGIEGGVIKTEIEKLNAQDRVYFTGKVSDAELSNLYRGALCLLFPSFYEGFGLPIVEAFACGTPVITSNLTSMPEIAGNAALLINPNDIADITAAIMQLYNSPALRAELAQRGLMRVKDFSWDAVAERVKAAIKSVETDAGVSLQWS